MPVPVVEAHEGRPALTADEARRRLAAVPEGTDEALAELHGVDPRTVRRWRAKVSS